MPVSFVVRGIVPIGAAPANALRQRDGALILDRFSNIIQTR